MTEDEVTKVLGDLHMLHLANEPKNIDDLIYSWLAFFNQDDARVITKACYIYTKIKKKRFWPTPTDIEDLKQRAQWLIEMDDEEQKKLNALGGARTNSNLIKQSSNPKTQPPRAPAIQIEEKRKQSLREEAKRIKDSSEARKYLIKNIGKKDPYELLAVACRCIYDLTGDTYFDKHTSETISQMREGK